MRILVVDDSIIYRKYLVDILGSITGIDDIREARNGEEAIQMQKQHPADIITLDIEMPVMNGIECIRHLLNENDESYILMISVITLKGAKKTIEAMNHGAMDFITKIKEKETTKKNRDRLTNQIKTKIAKIVLDKTKGKIYKCQSKNNFIHQENENSFKSPVDLVLIGSSTGGPKALQDLLKPLKKNRNYAIVIVQHMPPLFTAQLAQNLTKQTGHKIEEVYHGKSLKKGDIIIAKGGNHLVLEKSKGEWYCFLNKTPPVKSCRPSIDVTFKSVSKYLSSREVIAMILTGMGEDGLEGSLDLYHQGIPILTQDEESSVVYGMPKAVKESGIRTTSNSPPYLMEEAHKLMLQPF